MAMSSCALPTLTIRQPVVYDGTHVVIRTGLMGAVPDAVSEVGLGTETGTVRVAIDQRAA